MNLASRGEDRRMRERAGRKKQRQPGRHEGGGTSAGEEVCVWTVPQGFVTKSPRAGPRPL